MRTKITLFFSLLLLHLSLVNAQTDKSKSISLYGGLNLYSLSTKDFKDFDISDWESYGLRHEDPSSLEGRVRIKIADKDPKGLKVGFMIGSLLPISSKTDLLAEIQHASSSVSLTNLYIGINHHFKTLKNGTLALTAKFGYNYGSIDLGTIEMIRGYIAPVILPEGEFNVGDKLSLEFEGTALNLGLGYFTNSEKAINFFANANLNLGLGTKASLQSNGKSIPMSSNAVVKTDYKSTFANINPTFKAIGIGLQVGLIYRIGALPF
jgi:hypothetical protein